MALHAQRQRLDAGQQPRGAVGRQAGAEIAQTFRPRSRDECRRPELLGKNEPVIAGIGLGQGFVFARGDPVEAAGIDECAANHEAMPTDPLGQRMQDDIRAPFDRPAEIGRGESVVDQQRNAGVVSDLRDDRYVQHLEAGIADGLADEESGLRA